MNLLRYTLTLLFLIIMVDATIIGQIVRNGTTLYGNEWINYDQQYVRIKVGKDGIYRLTYQQLASAGLPVDQIDVATFRLYWLGNEQRLHTSKVAGPLTSGEYLEFYGEKNRSQFDRYLFSDPDRQMLNPDYGFTTDTSAYFLTWTSGSPSSVRYEVVENDLTGTLPPAKNWYLHREKLVLSAAHFKSTINTAGVRFSTYGEGEGFCTPEGTNHSFNLPVTNIAAEGPQPLLHFRMTGNLRPHAVTMKWNGQDLSQFNFDAINGEGGSILVDSTIELNRTDLKNTNTFLTTTSGGVDRIRFSIVELIYPRSLSFNQEDELLIQLEDVRDGAYLEIENFNHAGMAPRVYDLSNSSISNGTIEGNRIRLNLPAGPNNRQVLIVNAGKTNTGLIIEPTAWTDLRQSNANFIMVSHRDLFDDGQGNNRVSEYAQYRQTQTGGNYRTQIIEIQQLIDQFAYGVDKHPLSIKNFVNYISINANWEGPEFIFLVGKGLDYREARSSPETYDYLPVYGLPGSDNLLVSKGESSTPVIPVGRLAARNPEHIRIYLDKIKVMEDLIANAPQTIEDRAWMKKILHLGGGVGQNEVTELKNKLDEMKEITESGNLQSDVFSWSIQSQDIIDFNEVQSVLDLINSGTIIKTYFGHGSIFTTQFNGFEDPEFLDNKDRYSVMLSLGCHTGNLFIPEFSLGDANIFSVNKGASIYMATSGLGFLSALDIFGKEWYRRVSTEQLNEPIGSINQKVIQTFDNSLAVGTKTLMQQIMTHGDPAFKLSKLAGPDFTIDYQSVSFEPSVINSTQDSFVVTFDLYNLGSLTDDSLPLSFIHVLPGGQQVTLSEIAIKSQNFITKLNITLPLLKEFDLRGNNKLVINLNSNRRIDELPDPGAYSNNVLTNTTGEVGIRIPIVHNGVFTIYPERYSIVSSADIQLVSSTANPLSESQNYIIQIDTTILFNSLLKMEERITQKGGLIKWTPNVTWKPDVAYYWRISPDSTAEQGYIWSTSSFTYIPESPAGWYQGHYFQFLEGQPEGLGINSNRIFEFQKNHNEIRILNVRNNGEQMTEFFYDGQQFGSPLRSPLRVGFSFIVVNPIDQSWLVNDGTVAGSVSVSNAANLFAFDPSTPANRQHMIRFIDEIIPDDYYVFMYTHLKDTTTSFFPEEWASDSLSYPENLFSALERNGAKLIRQMMERGTVPYNFFFQKNGNVLAEDIASSPGEAILTSGRAGYFNGTGKYHSTTIGPASEWTEVDWKYSFSENAEGDQFKLQIYGLSSSESDPELLISDVPESGYDLTPISANNYPYLRLTIVSSDSVDRTSPTLDYWKVLYEGLPDVTFNANEHYLFSGDSANIGDEINLSFAIENISDYDLDSLLVSYTISNSQNHSQTFLSRYASLSAKASDILHFDFETSTFIEGPHILTINLNPDADQPEASFNNNFLLQKFSLGGDRINPILNVTFDGVRIMNRDIVSPNPVIQITIKDENETILIKDSSYFQVSLKYPDGTSATLDLTDPDLVFTPATTIRNQATLEIQKSFPEDGLYELTIQARDVSGNLSGNNKLIIEFQVINRTTATHVVPYPNPFTENTRFLYTITGNLPAIFKIQIMTVSGTVIKEISLTDQETLKIGTHLTDYVWDGTDEFNDRLANGVYLYRVVVKDEENQIYEHLSTAVDNFFENNLGKIVILR